MIFPLYSNSIQLEFRPSNHTYWVHEDGQKPYRVPGVTTITGIVDKSGPLKQWAVNATLSELKDCLLPDAPYTSSELEELFDKIRFAHIRELKRAADIGTVAHDHVERILRGDEPPLPDEPISQRCAMAGRKWVDSHSITPLRIEEPLYSKRLQVAGKPDLIAVVDGKISVVDFKTSSAVALEHVLQTAALGMMWEEEGRGKIEQRIVVRLDRETGEPDEHIISSSLEEDAKAFEAAVSLYKRKSNWEKERKHES